LYNNQQFEPALDLFDKSLEFEEFDKVLSARSYYWKGESQYRLHHFAEANEMYNRFLGYPLAASLEEFELIHYDIAYTFFNMKKYDDALDWFRRSTSLMKHSTKQILSDAYNRIGDCYFMKQTYWVAIENYEKAIAYHTADADYALFQKAFS